MTLTLPTEMEAYLQERLTRGDFSSPEEIVLVALKDFQEKERQAQQKFAELKALIDAGVRDADEGRLYVLDQAAIEKMIERAKERRRMLEESDL